MIKRISILLLVILLISSCSKREEHQNLTKYDTYINEENNLGLYAKIYLPENEHTNFLFSIQRDEKYYNGSCILIPNLDEVDSICSPVLDFNPAEFRLVYRPTEPKEDDILLTIGKEFFSSNYTFKGSSSTVLYSIPFNIPSEQSKSFLEDFEFVVVIDQTEYVLFRGISILNNLIKYKH